jgi:hypothetical protein
MTIKQYSITAAAVLALALSASAQLITYVDATSGGNTFKAPSAGGGLPFTVAPFGTQGPANDGLWDARAFGNGATIFQNASAGANQDTNAVRLATSVSGLSLGTYNVYVYFWSDNSPLWRIGASLSDSAGQLSLNQPGGAGVTQFYTGSDATVLSTALVQNPFASGVMVAEGNRRLYGVLVGTVNDTGFSVFVEGDRAMTLQNQRTWYDGVGYTLVPEPTAGAVLGLGTLVGMFAIRRRNQ